jgi:hypothetical protein
VTPPVIVKLDELLDAGSDLILLELQFAVALVLIEKLTKPFARINQSAERCVSIGSARSY